MNLNKNVLSPLLDYLKWCVYCDLHVPRDQALFELLIMLLHLLVIIHKYIEPVLLLLLGLVYLAELRGEVLEMSNIGCRGNSHQQRKEENTIPRFFNN